VRTGTAVTTKASAELTIAMIWTIPEESICRGTGGRVEKCPERRVGLKMFSMIVPIFIAGEVLESHGGLETNPE
jgi:hypothetical protein